MKFLGALAVLSLGLFACGRPLPGHEHPQASATLGPPVALISPLDPTPGCFTHEGRTTVDNASSDSERSMISAVRQGLEFQLSKTDGDIQLLTKPVLEDPRALQWFYEFDDGIGVTRVEGASLARGDGWGRLILLGEARRHGQQEDAPLLLDVWLEVSYSRTNTRYTTDQYELTLHEDYIYLITGNHRLLRACDPDTGMNIEQVEAMTPRDGRFSNLDCWIPGQPGPGPSAAPFEQEAFRASLRLRCLQIMERMELPR